MKSRRIRLCVVYFAKWNACKLNLSRKQTRNVAAQLGSVYTTRIHGQFWSPTDTCDNWCSDLSTAVLGKRIAWQCEPSFSVISTVIIIIIIIISSSSRTIINWYNLSKHGRTSSHALCCVCPQYSVTWRWSRDADSSSQSGSQSRVVVVVDRQWLMEAKRSVSRSVDLCSSNSSSDNCQHAQRRHSRPPRLCDWHLTPDTNDIPSLSLSLSLSLSARVVQSVLPSVCLSVILRLADVYSCLRWYVLIRHFAVKTHEIRARHNTLW